MFFREKFPVPSGIWGLRSGVLQHTISKNLLAPGIEHSLRYQSIYIKMLPHELSVQPQENTAGTE